METGRSEEGGKEVGRLGGWEGGLHKCIGGGSMLHRPGAAVVIDTEKTKKLTEQHHGTCYVWYLLRMAMM